ncbi:MAG: prepilin-type N-terminal cleavage/methylation domain-containing protein [Patescibacteria group bacterium]|nr:prepilin-type N-terminal cleavage/methylation domain-containing protein [Patescibacteria group bacterium]
MKLQIRKGFTLIELLVVMGIIALIAALTIPSYVSFSRSQELYQSALNLKAVLRDTQNRALSSEKSATNCTASDTLLGFYATLIPGNTSAGVGGRCGLINFNTASKSFSKTSSLQSLYTVGNSCSLLSLTQGELTIVYKPLDGSGAFYDGSLDTGLLLNSGKIALMLTNPGGQSYYVFVTNTGDIYEKKTCP